MRKIMIAADNYALQLGLVVSVEQAAELLGISAERVKQFCREERLAAKKIGRDWIVARLAAEQLAAIDRPPGRPSEELPSSSAPARKRIRKKIRSKRR